MNWGVCRCIEMRGVKGWQFELRGVGDYGVSVRVASGEAHRAVKITEEFLNSAKKLLG